MMSERVGSDMKTGDVFKVSPRDWGAVSLVESLSLAVEEEGGFSTVVQAMLSQVPEC